MPLNTSGGRDDRLDRSRTEEEALGHKSTPGFDPADRSRKNPGAPSGSEGGLGPAGQGVRSRRTEPKKDGTRESRKGEVFGEGNWSGRDSQRGPGNTGVGQRGSGDTAAQMDDEYED